MLRENVSFVHLLWHAAFPSGP